MMTAAERTRHRSALAFDWGLRWIGAAIGQTRTATAEPLATLKARDGIPDWTRIGALIDEWRPDVVVGGLPLNMDGSESDGCTAARRFGRRIAGRFGQIVEFQDERLSSREAQERGGERGRNEVHDRAAQVILEDWLAAQARSCVRG
jgi:putative Holliday junction resolvase